MAALTRRRLLIGGGAGIGLLVGFAAWPRRYMPALTAAPGETIYGPYLKIARDGQVIVAVPQAEHGQGIYTVLAQVAADELGADWRTVGVEASPLGAPYGNPLAAETLFDNRVARWDAPMLTAGSTSLRRFEAPLRAAGATARVLLCKAAARRWDADWRDCETADGFVTLNGQRLRFGDLAAEAAGEDAPDEPPLRIGDTGRLSGRALPRLDTPAKVAGAANHAADIRLPDMVFASIRQGPTPASRLLSADRAAADAVRGVVSVIATDHWIGAIGNSWWAADRGVTALAPRFATAGPLPDDAAVARALERALAADGHRAAGKGDVAAALRGDGLVTADYTVAPLLAAPLEPPAATAQWHGGRLELWLATRAPGLARAAAAAAIGVDEAQVTVHPMPVGGYGPALEHAVAAQAALLAVKLRRPVQLQWSRGEALLHEPVRAPARARMAARLGRNGAILGWHARIAAPATGAELARRLLAHDPLARAAAVLPAGADDYAVAGAIPPYRLPAFAVDHHRADLPVATGHVRGGAHGYTAFFTEMFVDDLARRAGTDPLSYRMAMLADAPRLARCLSTAAALAGWDGGASGSRMGIACHAMAGSFIAVVAELVADTARPRVDRLVAAVDGGRAINPDVVRQVVEGGLIGGAHAAFGGAAGWHDGLATVLRLDRLDCPTLATAPEVTVELIDSDAAPGGVSDLGVPAVAPAIANALTAATGTRPVRLPFGIHA